LSKAEAGRNSGTAEAFTELYEQFMPRVFSYICYRVGDIHLAEDLTSDVFLKALEGFSRYRSDIASFSTWLLSIARHKVIDHYRTSDKRRTIRLEKAAVKSSESAFEEEIARNEERKKLQLCLATLPAQEQEIISLKFGAELNNRQIAQMLGLSESNVGTKLYRAVRTLRDGFRGWQDGK
jgi:RNA polymerase sigma factor (sigma-70 family)